MKRTIYIPAIGNVSLRAYVDAVRIVIANPAREFRHGLGGWSPVTGAEIRREFRRGMHDRINRHIPDYGRGRKWDSDWQRACRQTARVVNTPRLVVRWVPADLRARLAHRLTEAP